MIFVNNLFVNEKNIYMSSLVIKVIKFNLHFIWLKFKILEKPTRSYLKIFFNERYILLSRILNTMDQPHIKLASPF